MRLKTMILTHPAASVVAALTLVLIAVGVAIPAFQASERPAFCMSCHEMRPYNAAWSTGPHASVDCIECHVEPGTVNRVTHKATATRELWVHLTGDPRFPQGEADVPDSRCLRCHADIARETPERGFSHASHSEIGPCVTCHAATGHKVTTTALREEGVLNADESSGTAASPAAGALLTPAVASAATGAGSEASGSAVGTSSAGATRSLTGTAALVSVAASEHVPVVCTRCHDLTVDECATCHEPAHVERGECVTCHQATAAWEFTHPASRSCTTCHEPPAKHRAGACTTCHTKTGVSWAFSHPTSKDCAACHKPPKNHYGSSCVSCHKVGVAFAKTQFRHINGVNCARCHKAPSRHFGSACASCHKVGVAFSRATYRHTSRNCSSCHKRPSGHKSGACATCHRRAGSSWAFSHPSSSRCTSCHRAPGSHYGSACASCHRSRSSWAAKFRHPALREHSYKSFACSNCHPRGYGSSSCTKCHGPGGPDDDGDGGDDD